MYKTAVVAWNLLPRHLPNAVWQVRPYFRSFGLPDVLVNRKATEELGLLGYDAAVLSTFRRQGRDAFIFKGQGALKMNAVEGDN
jgi:hypothetical protein